MRGGIGEYEIYDRLGADKQVIRALLGHVRAPSTTALAAVRRDRSPSAEMAEMG